MKLINFTIKLYIQYKVQDTLTSIINNIQTKRHFYNCIVYESLILGHDADNLDIEFNLIEDITG